MVRLIRLFPFSIAMLVIVIGVGLWTRTHSGPLSTSIKRDLGFSPLHLSRGEWARLLTCVFFTVGGVKFYASVVVMGVGVGAAEYVFGTGKAIAMFWGIHLVTLVVAALLLAMPLHALEFHRGSLLANVHDVGPSAGYYGCLGAACIALPARWRAAVIGAILTVLIGRLIWSFVTIPDEGRAMSADLAHIIAFPLGLLVAIFVSTVR